MKKTKSNILATCIASLLLSSCSTYETFDSARKMGDGTFVDETKGRYGQPYLLPKAVIHLVVRPVTAADAKASAASASAGDAPKKVGKAMGPATAALANFVSDMNLVIHGATKDDGIAAGAASAAGVEGEEYRIPAYYVLIERTIVPDKDSGPFYLHYSPNWFYTEATAVEVSDKHLLKSTTATSSDKTAQVLYNLTDATIELAKASAQIGTGVFASRNRAAPSVSFEPEIAAVQFRELNIDVVFDPLDDTDVERTRDLFADVTVGTTKLVSPFDLSVSTVKRHLWVPGPSGKFPNSPRDAMGCVDPSALPKDDVKRSGIWFREPTGIEVAVRHVNGVDAKVASANITMHKNNLNKLKLAKENTVQEAKDAAKQFDAATSKAEEAVKARRDAETKLAVAPNDARLKEVLEVAVKANTEADKGRTEAEGRKNTALQDSQAVEAEYARQKNAAPAMTDMLTKAARRSSSQAAEFITSIPRKDRVFSFNIARSAFVSQKVTSLTIVDGVLMKTDFIHPSEAEGFSDMIKQLATKVGAIPKALITAKKDYVTEYAALRAVQNTALTSEQSLRDAQSNSTLATTKAQTTLEKEIAAAEKDTAVSKKETVVANADAEKAEATKRKEIAVADKERAVAESEKTKAEVERTQHEIDLIKKKKELEELQKN